MINLKRVIAVVCLVCLLISLFAFNAVFAVSNSDYDSKLPGLEIKEKRHYNDLVRMKKIDEIKVYLESLDEKELLTTIAECSEELDRAGAYYEMQIFTDAVEKKLSSYLSEEDYISIIRNPSYNDSFKVFMIDTHAYLNSKEDKRNSDEFNGTLIDILNDDRQSAKLRAYALDNIDDYNNLNNVTRKIVNNFDDYSELEVNAAMKLLLRVSPDTVDTSGDKDLRIEDVEKVIRKSKDDVIKLGAVIALADAKNNKSVKTVVENKGLINDDGVIRYFIDKNYQAVNSMLNAENDAETIKIAFACIEIAPFRSFMPALEELNDSGKLKELSTEIEALISKIEQSSLDRHEKWDSR